MRSGGNVFSVYLANHHRQPETVLDCLIHHSPSSQDRSDAAPFIWEIGIAVGDVAVAAEAGGAIGEEVAGGIGEVTVGVGDCGGLDFDSAIAGPTDGGPDFRTAFTRQPPPTEETRSLHAPSSRFPSG